MNVNIKAVLMLSVGLLLIQTASAEPNPANGQRLFEASKCLSCHTPDSFSNPATRKVKSLADLEKQVRKCDANLSTNWYDDEILDVVAYLNKSYYKFP